MELRKKPIYSDTEHQRYDNMVVDALSETAHNANDWLSVQSQGIRMIIGGALFVGLFSLFKAINKGHVVIAAEGNNVVNMAALLLIDLFLQMIWMAYNGDETQGWGGM